MRLRSCCLSIIVLPFAGQREASGRARPFPNGRGSARRRGEVRGPASVGIIRKKPEEITAKEAHPAAALPPVLRPDGGGRSSHPGRLSPSRDQPTTLRA